MLAAVFHSPNNIKLEEVPLSSKKAILRVHACAVCGYDARVYRNGHRKVSPPVVLGHEFCGENLQDISIMDGTIKAGSRVAVCPLIPCLSCYHCAEKDYQLCKNLKEIGSTLNGGFAQYVEVPEQTVKIGGLVRVPDSLSDEETALLEPLSCCLNSFFRMDATHNKRPVVIIGDGPLGLLHLELFKKLAPAEVSVVGKIPFRMQKAESMNADAVFEYHDFDVNRTIHDVLDFTGKAGAGIVVVSTSNPEALDFATKIAGKNSKINIFAGMPALDSFPVDANWLHYSQISIMGTFSSTPAMLHLAANIADERTVDLSQFLTHRYSLPEIEKAMSATENYHGLRAVINKF